MEFAAAIVQLTRLERQQQQQQQQHQRNKEVLAAARSSVELLESAR